MYENINSRVHTTKGTSLAMAYVMKGKKQQLQFGTIQKLLHCVGSITQKPPRLNGFGKREVIELRGKVILHVSNKN